jgi:hypothetical protein
MTPENARRAQKRDDDRGQEQARRQGDRDGQRKWRLDEAGDAIKQACQAVDECKQQDETADAGGACV